jgi:hypothetical protein
VKKNIIFFEQKPFFSNKNLADPPKKLVFSAVQLLNILHFYSTALEGQRLSPQKNCPPETVKCPDSRITMRILASPEWSLTDGSNFPGRKSSMPPT